MIRKRLGLITVCLLIALGSGGGVLFWSVGHVPDFYEEALTAQTDPVVRKEAARKLVESTLHLVEEIQHAEAWSQEFHEQHVNSWLAEELHTKYAEVVPKGVRDPRVRFVPGAVLVGFRLEQKNFSGVISLRLRPWVADPNRLAVEIVSVRAGLLRIPIDNVLVNVVRQIEKEGWQVEWKQADGNDVLVLHLDRGELNQPVLEGIEIVEEKARVVGRRRSVLDIAPPESTRGALSVASSPQESNARH